MSDLRQIWTPLTIGSTTVKHRIMMTPHGQQYGEENVPSERHIAYYRERAKGGAALVGIEQTAAHRWGKGAFPVALTAWEKRSIPHYEKLADAMHEYDCKVFVELATVGVHDRGRTFIDDWHPVWGPSSVPSVYMNEIPVEMDQAYINELVGDFGQTAANLEVAGVDGVELHGAHGYMLMQFLSPHQNKRTDAYGGSVKNRCRLPIEIAQEIRDRVGTKLTLGIRLSYDEFLGEVGITPELSEEYLDIFAGTGLFDFFDLSCGGYHTLHYSVAPMGSVEEGFLIPYGRRAKEVVGDRAKVFIVGRIKSLAMAEQAISEGSADMVAMLRAQIADPFLVKKGIEGREDEIVRCVGANECLAAGFHQQPVTCTVNPAVGRERQWGEGTLVQAESARRVLVLGGGPGGMRVAATAAERGHDVALVELEEQLGGHLNLLKRLPTRDDWQLAIDNLSGPLGRLGVDVRLGVEATEELVAAEAPDVVVCATGSTWDRTGFSSFRPERESIPGVDQDNVLDAGEATERALADPSGLGERVVILDETGSYLPLGLSEVLANAGCDVEIFSRHLILGQELSENLEMAVVFPRLAEAGVKLSPQWFVESIEGSTVEVYSIWGGERRRVEGVDTVVLSLHRSPADGLYHALAGNSIEVHRIGDALAPRKAAEAIYEGEKLGRAL